MIIDLHSQSPEIQAWLTATSAQTGLSQSALVIAAIIDFYNKAQTPTHGTPATRTR